MIPDVECHLEASFRLWTDARLCRQTGRKEEIMNEIKKIFDIFQNISLSIIFQHNVDKDASWNEHKTNKDYTLWLVTNGNIIVEMNGNTIKASTHDVILFYPGDSYSAYTDCETCSFIFLFFKMGTGNMIDIFHSRNASGLY